MKNYLLCILLFLAQTSFGQNFIRDFQEYNHRQIKSNNILDSLRKTNLNKNKILTRKKIKVAKQNALKALDEQVHHLDSIIMAYKIQTQFDFNIAETLVFIYQTDIQSGLNNYILFSGKDTITFGDKWQRIGLHQSKKEIISAPFTSSNQRTRDTLIALAAKHDFITAESIAKKNNVLDGVTSTIFFAQKIDNHYRFKYCFLQPFSLY